MRSFPILRAPDVSPLSAAAGLLLAMFFVSQAWADSEEIDSKAPGSIEFVAENLFSTAEGRFHEWRVVESAVDPATLEESHVTVEVTLNSVDTGSRRRDEHLRTADFFEVETHPVATVRGHSLVASGEDEEGQRLFRVQFDVDLHGVKKTLEGQLRLTNGDPLVATGSLVLDRMDFGIGPKPSRWNPMSIDPEIPIEFHIEF